MVLSKKSFRWALALFIVLGVTATVMWRLHRHEQKAAEALARKASKSSSKAKSTTPPPEESADAPETPAPEKAPPKVTVLGPAAKEHLAEKAFITALRSAFLWRSSQPQPQSPEVIRGLLEKLSAIAVDDLPPERKSAWLTLLKAWGEMKEPGDGADADPNAPKASAPKMNDPQIQDQARQAAETLNLMLKAHGDVDLVF